MEDKEFDKKAKEVRDNDNLDDIINLYKSYVGKAETYEQRKRRINRFRCGGR